MFPPIPFSPASSFEYMGNPDFLSNAMHYFCCCCTHIFSFVNSVILNTFFPMFFFMFSYSFEPSFLWQFSREKDVVPPKDYLNYNLKRDHLRVCFFVSKYWSLLD